MEQEKLKIQCDEYNWTLIAERVVTKKGSKNIGGTYEHTIGYFSSLKALANYAIERQLRVHGLDNYEVARDELQRVMDETIEKVNVHTERMDVKKYISDTEDPELTKMKRGRKKKDE